MEPNAKTTINTNNTIGSSRCMRKLGSQDEQAEGITTIVNTSTQ